MSGVRALACLWVLVLAQTGPVSSDLQFIQRSEGGSVQMSCELDRAGPSPFGVYLKRRWLRTSEVLFKYTGSDIRVSEGDRGRILVSGDPASRALNISLTQLRPSDTDRYECVFVVDNNASEDEQLQGKNEFFLLVNAADAPDSGAVGLIETCVGGSATLPCVSPNPEGLAVEGVSLQRQRGREPVELLYHSKQHHGPPSSTPSSSSSSSLFPVDRIQLSSAPGPGGLTYNLSLQQLQPEDSGLYSCQLLLRGRPGSSARLSGQVFFVSVQGGQCSCSNYSILLYALSAAVGTLLLLLIGLAMLLRVKSRGVAKAQSQAPIYEEMTGVQSASRKLAPSGLEDMDASSEYRNYSVKKPCSGNYYESPRGALYPRGEAEK